MMNFCDIAIDKYTTTELLLMPSIKPSLENRKPFAINSLVLNITIKSVLIISLYRFARMNQ